MLARANSLDSSCKLDLGSAHYASPSEGLDFETIYGRKMPLKKDENSPFATNSFGFSILCSIVSADVLSAKLCRQTAVHL
jgi:hypothetical protein